MRTRIVAIALIALLPAAGLAQKGGSSGSDDQGGGSGAKSPSSRDLSDMSPASLLLDKKKKLSLADSTVNQLKAAQKKISDRNAAFYAGYDSTRKWTMPLSSSSSSQATAGLHGGSGDSKLTSVATSPAEQAKMQSSMRDLRKLMTEFRELRKADIAEALAMIPESQKAAATELIEAQTAEVEKRLSGR